MTSIKGICKYPQKPVLIANANCKLTSPEKLLYWYSSWTLILTGPTFIFVLDEDDFLFFIEDNISYIIGLAIVIIILLLLFFIKIRSVKKFFLSILEGLLSILKLKKDLPWFILATVTIWGGYFTAFYMIKFSIPEFSIIPTELIFPTFVVSVFSISLSNHGLGVYPLAISLFLLEFAINTEIGLAYGWLAWSCQAIITLIFGGLSFFVLPLFNSSD